MARPRFEVVDDPLALSADKDRRPEAADAATRPEPAVEPATRKPSRQRKQERTTTDRRPAERSGAQETVQHAGLWEPPSLDEPLTLVATRLPQSLDRALDEHTQQLRRRRDGASQKRLPKQEVLAMAVWALGDPADERAHAKLEALYEQYRGRRLAAAAAAAIESSLAPPED